MDVYAACIRGFLVLLYLDGIELKYSKNDYLNALGCCFEIIIVYLNMKMIFHWTISLVRCEVRSIFISFSFCI